MPKDKLKTIYVCNQCGETSPRWMGRCPSCGAWNTMTEDVVAEPTKSSSRAAAPVRVTGQTSLTPQKLKNISTTEEKSRIVTGISELDRVLGGGIVIGSVTLIGGEAGSFLGEYQAGGLILVLGLHTDGRPIVHFFPCTGMHGGKMVFRGDVSSIRFPDQVTLKNDTAEDMEEITPYVREYCRLFDRDAEAMLRDNYTVITPDSKNPYQQMYVAN